MPPQYATPGLNYTVEPNIMNVIPMNKDSMILNNDSSKVLPKAINPNNYSITTKEQSTDSKHC